MNTLSRPSTSATLARCLAASILLLAIPASASDYGKRAQVTLKALSFEQTLAGRAGGTVDIAILYKSGNGASESCAKGWSKVFGKLRSIKLKGKALKITKAPLSALDSLPGKGVDVILVCDGLTSDIPRISGVASKNKLLTIGVSTGDLKKGLALGVFMNGAKPKIVVNLKYVKKSKLRFSSLLLTVSQII